MSNKTLKQLNEDIFQALTYNSGMLKQWMNDLGDVDPYKGLMTFDKISGTFLKLKEFEESNIDDKGFNIEISVQDEEGKAVLKRLLDNNAEAIDKLLDDEEV